MQVEVADFEKALSEIKPAFGAVTETLEQYRLNGIIDSGEKFRHLQSTCRNLIEQASRLVQCGSTSTGTVPPASAVEPHPTASG